MRRLVLGLALVAVLAGCGGSGGTAGDPVAAVNNVINAIKSKQFSSIPPMLCTAKRDTLAKKLDPGAAAASGAPGNAGQVMRDAMSFKIDNLQVNQVSNDGSKAVVSVKGQMTVTIDPGKAKDVAKAILTGMGQTPTDAQVDQMAQQLTQGTAKPTDIDSQVDVVKEGSAWLLCSSFTS